LKPIVLNTASESAPDFPFFVVRQNAGWPSLTADNARKSMNCLAAAESKIISRTKTEVVMQIRLFVAAAVLLAVLALPLAAQPQQRSNIPTQPAPRRADGTLNLGSTEPNKGFWMPRQHWGYEEVLIEGKEIPYQPWAKALREFRQGTL